jgi:cysteine synthase B
MLPLARAHPQRVLEGPRRLADLVGNTPLLDLSSLVGRPGVRLLGKAELANPGGSVKDRPGKAMVEDAVRRGLLRTRTSPGGSVGAGDAVPAKRILDSTSGNTGIAYAWLGAALGIPVTLCLPANASPERKRILKAYGVELHLTDPMEGSDGAIRVARKLAAERPDLYSYLDQYSNPENWGSHYRTTGPEIWDQTDGEVTHFITGLGTSGTFVGVGRYLREQVPGVRLISVEPDSPFHGLEGMKHMATAIVPPIYDRTLADEARTCGTEVAQGMVRRLARELGLMVGVSSGCNVASALRLADEVADGSTIVTILCDGADKYLSERFWEDA